MLPLTPENKVEVIETNKQKPPTDYYIILLN